MTTTTAKLWVQDDDNDYDLYNAYLDPELADASCIQITINIGGQVNNLMIELNEHEATMLACTLSRFVVASTRMREEDREAAIAAIHREINGEEE